MKKKITLLVVMVFMTLFQGHAQTQFWSDTFESGPSSGTRTPEENGGTTAPSASYFKLTNGSDILQVVPFSGKEGSNFWAGEDHNALGTGFTASGAVTNQTANATTNELHIIWSGINISGKTGLSFKGLIAAASTNEPWDNTNACISGVGTTNTDYIIVEYQIDGGAYTPLIRFYNRGSASGTGDKYLFEDTDGNGCGDGTQLTNAFAEFTKTIAGTGTTLNLRIRVFSEGNNEEWGIDNFRLFETPTCTAPVVTANPPNRSVCNGSNTTFTTTATGATGYQWQVNTGSGFTNIANGAPYSNATTNTLTITGATTGMNGYIYRCVAYNGTISCFTNSNNGTLSISSINTTVGSQNNVLCNGGSNGSATIVPSGGIGGYTYSWAPSGGTGATASGLAAGTYTVTVTDGIGCQATRSYTIVQPAAALGGTISKTDVSCNGGSNGTATVSITGGTPSYTYSWSPSGGTAATATGLANGTYTCTITDANGCQITRSITVNQPAAALGGTISKTDVSCNGGSNGTATVSITGGTPSYTYSWAPTGGTNATATGLVSGTYTCTITDANSCQITRSITVNQPAATLGGTISKTDVSCNGGSNGTATVSITGGTPSYTYSWSPSGGTAATASGLANGTYTCTITDANGCQITRSITVNQPAATLGGTISKTDVSCNGGSNGTATVSITGGTPSYTYSWSPSGGTAATASGLANGTYTCTITDANGCQITRSITVNQPAATLGGTISKTDVSCNGGSNGTATVSITGGTPSYTYSWSPSGGTAATATGLANGTYTCTITDANGCQITRSITVNQPTALVATAASQTNILCNGGTNGSATVNVTGGTGAYTYSWSPSGGTAATASGLAAGTYTCTITDANSCQTTQSFTITEPTALVATAASQTNILCNGGTNGSATVNVTGGTGAYTYSWSPSGGTAATASGLAAGTYTCTITDANSCQTTQSFTITEPIALMATAAAQTNILCNGGSNGSATVNVTGGTGTYTYSWSPSGGTAATASGLAAGTYTCTITDANSCQTTQSFTITEPSALSVTDSQTNVSCNAGTNGSATVNVTGGTGAYTYSWSPSGGTAATASGLAAGTYTCTITDANSCQTTQSFTITEPSALSVTDSQTNVSCNGGSNGSATVNVTGGTGAYTYSWAPSGGTAATASGLAAGTYTCTITDANSCQTTQSFTITEPSAFNITNSHINVSCNGAANGSATVSVTGGTGAYTYSWAPSGGTAATASGLAPGTYTCTITDANSCQTTSTFTINEPTALDNSITLNSTTLTANQAGATYQWIDCTNGNILLPGETNQNFTPSVSGDYAVVITMGSCSVTSPCSTVLGTVDFESNTNFVVYPNPSTGIVTIKSSFDGQFQIINQLGQIVRAIDVLSGIENTINLENVAKGIYHLSGITKEGTKVNSKIILN